MEKPSLQERFRYWFDNSMSKGSISLIRVLVIFTILAVAGLSGLIILFKLSPEKEGFAVFWGILTTVINAWMPAAEEGGIGYLILASIGAVVGLLITSVLIGIVTSTMEEKIISLRKGNSPVIENDHIIVLGFYPGEYTLIRQLILAAGSQPLTIVIGAEMERDELEQYVDDNIEKPANVKIVCRTVDLFDPMSIEHLSVHSCRTVIISPTDDNTTVKILLAVSALIQSDTSRRIRVNAITAKEENRFPPNIARKHNVTTLQTNDTLAKIIAHSCTQTGLSEVFKEIFNFEGSELYLIEMAGTAGMSFMELMSRLDKAVPIGLYRSHEMMMNPDPATVIEENDRILVFAPEKNSAVLRAEWTPLSEDDELKPIKPESNTKTIIIGHNSTLKVIVRELPENVQEVTLVNFDGHNQDKIEKTCAERNINLVYESGDPREEMELLRLTRNTEHVILLSNFGLDEEEADMETIFLLLNLRELRYKYHLRFDITAEMKRERNQSLIVSDDHTDFVVASNMTSLFLAQLAQAPELRKAFAEILSNEGNELYLKTAKNLHCSGSLSVCELRQRLYRQGYIFLGIIDENNEYLFNPSLDQKLEIDSRDKLIVFGEN